MTEEVQPVSVRPDIRGRTMVECAACGFVQAYRRPSTADVVAILHRRRRFKRGGICPPHVLRVKKHGR